MGKGGAAGAASRRATVSSHYPQPEPDRGGALFYRHCLRALEEVRLGETALASNKLTPQRQIEGLHAGAVRPAVRGPILLALAKAHPGLALELSFSDRKVDLVEEGWIW